MMAIVDWIRWEKSGDFPFFLCSEACDAEEYESVEPIYLKKLRFSFF